MLGDRRSSALRRGPGQGSSLQAAVTYYAYHLATDTAQGTGDPEHLTEPEQQMLLRWAAELGAPPEVAQGRLAAPARAAADWIARKVGLDSKLVRLLVTTFCREVHLYLTDPARRHAVRDEVADTIAAHQPAAVIAHSLGSVVTYETLSSRTTRRAMSSTSAAVSPAGRIVASSSRFIAASTKSPEVWPGSNSSVPTTARPAGTGMRTTPTANMDDNRAAPVLSVWSCSVLFVSVRRLIPEGLADIAPGPELLRHEALCYIPYRIGRDLEEYSWVRCLTWSRKAKGTAAWQQISDRVQAYGAMH